MYEAAVVKADKHSVHYCEEAEKIDMHSSAITSEDNTNIIDVTSEQHVAQLEATNAALRAELSSKESYIAMLEERLLKMSVELASSRAREDEQHLMMYRRRSSLPLPAAAQDFVPDAVMPRPMWNNKSDRHSRRSSSEKEVDNTDDSSTRSAPVGTGGLFSNSSYLDDSSTKSGLFSKRFSLDDSVKSFSSRSFSEQIGLFSRRNSDELSVGFPETRRPSGCDAVNESSRAFSKRVSIGSMFRKSDDTETTASTASSAAEELATEEEQQEQSEQNVTQRRRPSRRGRDPPQAIATSSRSFLSCVAFPREDDDTVLGFE